MAKKSLLIKISLWLLFLALFSIAAYGVFFIFKINQTGNKINTAKENDASLVDTALDFASAKPIKLDGIKDGRINILLLGISGKGIAGTNLTDTIMIASINIETNQVALLSIPRDLYVSNASSGFQSKINTAYEYGLENFSGNISESVGPLKNIIEDITSLKIHYWIIMDFSGFERAIDIIGGINVMNERDIYDPRYPGLNYSYETFELEKGLQHLNGSIALKYARMRHNDPEGDFGRAKRQQQVLQATKNKIFSSRTFLNISTINRLFNALGDNIKTNIKTEEYDDFLELSKKIDTNNINNVVLDAWNSDSLLMVSHVFYGDIRAFVLVSRIGNWSEVQYLSQNIFDVNSLKKRREQILAENAIVVVMNKSGNAQIFSRIQNLLKENFYYKNVIVLNAPKGISEEKTIVYDLANGKNSYTLDELAKKLPASISERLPENYRKTVENIKADIIITVGKDLIEKYSMEKDSFEEYNKDNE